MIYSFCTLVLRLCGNVETHSHISARMDFEWEDFIGILRVALIVPSCEEKFWQLVITHQGWIDWDSVLEPFVCHIADVDCLESLDSLCENIQIHRMALGTYSCLCFGNSPSCWCFEVWRLWFHSLHRSELAYLKNWRDTILKGFVLFHWVF